MEKNVIVTDITGKIIGETYPKRARGLVKNGRAEYVSDCEICLRFQQFDGAHITHVPSVNKYTEDNNMSKAINFNAREFSFDSECSTNVGSRMFVTDFNGKNTEQYEIGDWNWSWTQIRSEKQLEKNTDYLFRFAMTGGHNDTDDAVSQFIIFFDNDWENRYVYPLNKSRFKPVVSKRDPSGLLRVFEIPFNTGDAEKTTFLFIAQHAVARFYAPDEISAYAELDDLSYSQWWEERSAFLHGGQSVYRNRKKTDFSGNPWWENEPNKFDCFDEKARFFGFNGSESDNSEHYSQIKISCESKTERELGNLLYRLNDGGRLAIDNSNLSCSPDGEIYNNIGSPCDGVDLEINNSNMAVGAFSMVVNKIGDGGHICFSNCNVSNTAPYINISSFSDGMVAEIHNCKMTAMAISLLIGKMGDGCCITVENSIISEEGVEKMYYKGRHGDGVVINFIHCTLPAAVKELAEHSLGDGCSLDFSTSTIK